MARALLIGINTYESVKPNLNGCEKDVHHMYSYLTSRFGKKISVEKLLSKEAKKVEIIRAFEEHLINAIQPGELALFHFSGHGSKEESPEEFLPLQGYLHKNESLVCYDSRSTGISDLADKELNYLIRKLHQRKAEIVIILDCCHSGSGTRDQDDILLPNPRQAPAHGGPRDRSSYLVPMEELMQSLKQALPPYIQLSACRPHEKSRERYIEEFDHSAGVFSYSLLKTAERLGPKISYRELMFHTQNEVKRSTSYQHPMLEVMGGASSFRNFLGKDENLTHQKKYQVFYHSQDNSWRVNLGAINGMPPGIDEVATFDIYKSSHPDGELKEKLGSASTTVVHLENSQLALSADLGKSMDPDKSYPAKASHLPMAPLAVYLSGYKVESFRTQLVDSLFEPQIRFTTEKEEAAYELFLSEGSCQLRYRETQEPILPTIDFPEKKSELSIAQFLSLLLKHIENWERMRRLRVKRTKLRKLPEELEFRFIHYPDEGPPHRYHPHPSLAEEPIQELTLDVESEDQEFPYAIQVNNPTGRKLYYYLLLFDRKFAIHAITPEEPINRHVSDYFLYDSDVLLMPPLSKEPELYQLTDTFKLIISLQPLEYFHEKQERLFRYYEKLLPHFRKSRDSHQNTYEKELEKDSRRTQKDQANWYCQDINVKMLRTLGELTSEGISIAEGQIKLKGPHGFQAKVSLSSSANHMNGPTVDQIIPAVLEKKGLAPYDFSSQGKKYCILELHHIEGKEVVSQQAPLLIDLNLPGSLALSLVALTLDPERSIVNLGKLERLERDSGKFRLTLERIPGNPHDGRIAPGSSLKIWFGVGESVLKGDL